MANFNIVIFLVRLNSWLVITELTNDGVDDCGGAVNRFDAGVNVHFHIGNDGTSFLDSTELGIGIHASLQFWNVIDIHIEDILIYHFG